MERNYYAQASDRKKQKEVLALSTNVISAVHPLVPCFAFPLA